MEYDQYGNILKTLIKKEFKIRYRHSILGFLWSLLNPLAMMLILTLVFSVFLKSSIPNYPVFLLIGLLAWRFFSVSTNMSLSSIVNNAPLVTKIYFPREILVLSTCLANLIGSSLEFLILIPLMILLGAKLTFFFLLLPLALLIEFVLVIGISFILSSLNVYYRDSNEIWSIILQIGFFITPIFYDVSQIPSQFMLVYTLNPLVRLIQFYRKILFYGILPTLFDLMIVAVSGVIFFSLGFWIFRRLEPRFAEEL